MVTKNLTQYKMTIHNFMALNKKQSLKSLGTEYRTIGKEYSPSTDPWYLLAGIYQ